MPLVIPLANFHIRLASKLVAMTAAPYMRACATAVAAVLLVLSVAGQASADDPLAGIKEKVRAEFPDVRQLHVQRYQPEEGQILLDVRESDEFAISHLRGATLATDLSQALAVLADRPKDTPIVTYCSVGWRSSKLASELASRGFTNVQNLEGSIFEWANNGNPVYRANEQVKDVHPFNWRWGRYLDDELATKKPR